jgi:hypothetical protein
MRALDIIAGAALAAAIVALPFTFFNWSNYLTRRRISFPTLRDQVPMPMKSVLFFAIPILIGLAAGETSREIAHGQVLDKLDSLKSDYHVSINGKAAPNPDQILATLKTLDWLSAHHSSPTKRINVEISDHSRIVLSLARDSANPREYWVFYPEYYITASNEIGRIITPLFDEY